VTPGDVQAPARPRARAATRVVLFDLGGVLVELAGIQQMLDWCGGRYSEDELWRAWLASDAVRRFESGGCGAAEFAAALIAEMRLPVGAAEFIAAFRSWPTRIYPGAADYIDGLRARFTTACLSNTNELHWPLLHERFGIGELFDHRFASHETGLLKPDAEAFHHAASTLGVEPEAILFVDDNPSNVAAAQAAGLRAHHARGFEAARALLERELAP
jgi:putative hydrolase of the HAD superfamily